MGNGYVTRKIEERGLQNVPHMPLMNGPLPRLLGKETSPVPLTSPAALKMQIHPLLYDIYGLSFKNLLYGEVCSCDSS